MYSSDYYLYSISIQIVAPCWSIIALCIHTIFKSWFAITYSETWYICTYKGEGAVSFAEVFLLKEVPYYVH